MRQVAAWLLAFVLGLGVAQASADNRVALIIGVSNYAQVAPLPNPVRDADTMSALFKSAGFTDVVDKRDLTIAELRRAIRDFSEQARDADIAVVYYAGHGIEVDGTNYLVPADAKLTSDFDIEDETISLDRLLKALDPAKRLKLVILDACRDNPFARAMKRSAATRAIGRGLAKIEPTTPDTLIAFAAKAGAVAEDGIGASGPFAAALAKHITEPGLDLRLALGRVRDDVMKTTGNRQEPFVYGSLGGSTMSLVPPPPKVQETNAEARVDFELAAQIGTRLAWEAFLAKYKTGLYADMARIQNRRLTEAEEGRQAAEVARREAERIAAEKTEELRKQSASNVALRGDGAKPQPGDEVKKNPENEHRLAAEQAQRELDEARGKLETARRDAEAARQEVEEAKRTAAADAQKQARADAERQGAAPSQGNDRLASLPDPAASPSPPKIDLPDTARLLQAHLRRVGCDPGTIDGKWTDRSQRALEQFRSRTQGKFDSRMASLDALDAVRAKPHRICPLQCPAGQRAEGERCIQVGCERGFALNGSGGCERRAERPSRPRVAVRRENPAPRARASSGGKCFVLGGKSYCE